MDFDEYNEENITSARDILSSEKIMYNSKILHSSRAVTSIAAGFFSGILGLTGVYGILPYVLAMVLLNFLMTTHTSKVNKRIMTSTSWLWTEGWLSGFASFILIWTLIYDYIHVY